MSLEKAIVLSLSFAVCYVEVKLMSDCTTKFFRVTVTTRVSSFLWRLWQTPYENLAAFVLHFSRRTFLLCVLIG